VILGNQWVDAAYAGYPVEVAVGRPEFRNTVLAANRHDARVMDNRFDDLAGAENSLRCAYTSRFVSTAITRCGLHK
jgi:hypothetical protein